MTAKKSTPKPKSKKATAAKPKTGRPKGSRTQTAEVVDNPLSTCAKCNSTEREPYWKSRVIEQSGVTVGPVPRPFDRIVLRWTKCRTCGQIRIDRSHEFSGQK